MKRFERTIEKIRRNHQLQKEFDRRMDLNTDIFFNMVNKY